MKQPVRVAVTGAAGQISYSLLFRIASRRVKDQPVIYTVWQFLLKLKRLQTRRDDGNLMTVLSHLAGNQDSMILKLHLRCSL